MFLILIIILIILLYPTDMCVKTGGKVHKGINLDDYEDNVLISLKNNPNDLIIKSWFPQIKNKKKIQIVKESIFSISNYKDADKLTSSIINKMKPYKPTTITDATANVGGNTISFAKRFNKVNSVEINTQTAKALQNNINVYGLSNVSVYNKSYLSVINELKQDVLFMDPPWGGVDYKSKDKIMLYLDEVPIHDVINRLINKPILIVLKIPNNFDIELFKKNINHYTNIEVLQYPKYKIIMAK